MNLPGKAFGVGELYFQHEFGWSMVLSWEKDGVTTILTSRSSRILVSSFGRASNVQSKAETGSTFARQSEKRTKYARKNRPPPRCRTKLDQMGSCCRSGNSIFSICFRNRASTRPLIFAQSGCSLIPYFPKIIHGSVNSFDRLFLRNTIENVAIWKLCPMRLALYAFFHLYVNYASPWTENTTLPITASTADIAEMKTPREEVGEIEPVPMTVQVMDPNIKITDVPDMDEDTEAWDANWDKNKAIRDVAYYIRAHKFQDFDRRYYRRLEDSPSRFYQVFPKPPLRSLHWEVRRHCDASFIGCLKYLERTIKLTALRREDDTVTIMKEQKWNLVNNTKQLLSVQRDCQMAQRRDNLTMVPFQGPIERFQWRTTASYYMCWYTMLGVPELSIFGESCGNHANCQIEYGADNGDPRADDTKPYACALYSFCPDHCCPMRHIRYITDCYHTPFNPCYAGNSPSHRTCTLDRQENQDFLSLIANRINISCYCRETGYEWSSRFGICVDVNECTRGQHDCVSENQVCINMPGSYQCVCKFGYVYDPEQRSCILNSAMEELFSASKTEDNVTKTKAIIETIIKTITRSTGNRLANDHVILTTIFTLFCTLPEAQ